MIVSSQEHPKRDEFFKAITEENFGAVVDEYFGQLSKNRLVGRIKNTIRKVLNLDIR